MSGSAPCCTSNIRTRSRVPQVGSVVPLLPATDPFEVYRRPGNAIPCWSSMRWTRRSSGSDRSEKTATNGGSNELSRRQPTGI